MTFLADSTDITRIHFSSRLNPKQRSQFGQFLTPAPVARFMARQFSDLSGKISLLDPGAGVGVLTAAFVEQLLANPDKVESCLITAYEVEPYFLSPLKQCLIECCTALINRGIQADYDLHQESFIKAFENQNFPLFSPDYRGFSHAILNPPYQKLHSKSVENKILSTLGIKTVNLYSAFTWLTVLQLLEQGEIVAITPRSFCNGVYFRPFRQAFLEQMILKKIHVFESRSAAFYEDKVLQENIIFHAIKTKKNLETVEITNNSGVELDQVYEFRFVPYLKVIESQDCEHFIHLPINALEDSVRAQMQKFSSTLDEIGLEISTGPVVDFRLKSALRNHLNEQNVPLIYPESIKTGTVKRKISTVLTRIRKYST